eukprot:CAMPEP_0175152138 /NCGR_PEP_ID=MMETSP0087-20121206/18932_1 /TAXON_ID=136419 /ORGANISM="Unknown Unknown, Strain D1" /LENGTH=210 /DNA_ID=CAMNT_0016438507 /DNA_START=27 /DNA_END=659 /DNA_ORIENTATION=+
MAAADATIVANRFNAKETHLVTCLQNFQKFAKAVENGEQSCPQLAEAISRQIAVYQQSITTAGLSHATYEREIDSFQQSQSGIETKLQTVNAEILELQAELEKEKLVRQQKEEYDLLMTQINKHPSRQTTHNEILRLQQELQQHQQAETQLEQELEGKRRQFGLFFHALSQLAPSQQPDPSNPSAGAVAEANPGTVEEGEAEDDDVAMKE